MARKTLLACGILSSLLYVGTDALGALWWQSYSYIDQTISELSASDAPSRPVVIPLFFTYGLLVIAFGFGVRQAARDNRALRIAGALVIGYGALCLSGPFGPMHRREALAAGGATLTDTMHLIGAAVDVLFMLSVVAFAAAALGRRFRYYSIATVFVMLAFGWWSGLHKHAVEINLPTPGLGLIERACVFSGMLWFAVLSVTLLRSEKGGIAMTTRIGGIAKPGFEGVRDTFVDNFASRGELGGACCAYQHGEKVVDLWGGIRNKKTREPWDEDTMVIVYSATKGLAAMTMAMAHSRRWLDYEERVCTYWPEFAQQGKDRITVRQLLSHQAGLFALDQPLDRGLVADLDRLAVVLARQKPAWEPGSRQAYHAITLGFYESELLRRIDPQHRSVGRFFQDEIATPLGLDLYLRLPETIPNSRLATMAPPSFREQLFGFPLRFMFEAMNSRSNITRALSGSQLPHDESRIYARDFEVPSGGAVGTARAIARAYSVFATGGRELGLRKETLDLLAAPAIPPVRGFYDECMKAYGVQFSLGFMKPTPVWPFGSPSSFGSPGSGGSLGFADPENGVGYAYVTSKAGTVLTGDPRDVALRDALYNVIAHGETRRDRISPAA